jgi:hypothetical protein
MSDDGNDRDIGSPIDHLGEEEEEFEDLLRERGRAINNPSPTAITLLVGSCQDKPNDLPFVIVMGEQTLNQLTTALIGSNVNDST